MTNVMSPMVPSAAELSEIVEQVWSSFLDGEFVVIPDDISAEHEDTQVVASVSISGEWSGHVMIVTGRKCADNIAATMFGMGSDEVSTAETADALGEIANMVGGSVKGMVGVTAELSLPQVILDASALVNPDAKKLVGMSARWQGKPVDVSIWERSADDA